MMDGVVAIAWAGKRTHCCGSWGGASARSGEPRLTVTELAERSSVAALSRRPRRATRPHGPPGPDRVRPEDRLGTLCDLPALRPRSERVALVGLRGAGKSTLGRRLAQAMEAPFVELDERVERLAGLSLAAIFDLEGVETYRRLEREALEEVLAEGQRMVIATGGSIVTSEESWARVREACTTIWLRALPSSTSNESSPRGITGRWRASAGARPALRHPGASRRPLRDGGRARGDQREDARGGHRGARVPGRGGPARGLNAPRA